MLNASRYSGNENGQKFSPLYSGTESAIKNSERLKITTTKQWFLFMGQSEGLMGRGKSVHFHYCWEGQNVKEPLLSANTVANREI